jgi:hypothetical protein
MPTILSFSQGNFAANRIGVRAPLISQMPGLKVWWFPRLSLAQSPNQAPGGATLSLAGSGQVFQPTYLQMPGSSTQTVSVETGIAQESNFTLMMVARTVATAHFSSMFYCQASGPSSGAMFYLYNVGSQIASSVTGPQSGTPPVMQLTAGAAQNWGFYALRCQNGVGVRQFAKTDGNKTADTLSAIAPTLSPTPWRMGMGLFSALDNAALDIAFAGIVSGPTAGSALSDTLVEQCFQSVKYSLSFDNMAI